MPELLEKRKASGNSEIEEVRRQIEKLEKQLEEIANAKNKTKEQ